MRHELVRGGYTHLQGNERYCAPLWRLQIRPKIPGSYCVDLIDKSTVNHFFSSNIEKDDSLIANLVSIDKGVAVVHL